MSMLHNFAVVKSIRTSEIVVNTRSSLTRNATRTYRIADLERTGYVYNIQRDDEISIEQEYPRRCRCFPLPDVPVLSVKRDARLVHKQCCTRQAT